ncbi:MAG TPA: ribosome biogenesis GTPase Der [Polyangia bacterium]|jgi:GTP-binding protein
MPPLVAIVGRPNVGKSTLFNRLIGQRTAIVEDQPGVTRDRRYAEGDWNGRVFRLVDTGGLAPGEGAGIAALVHQQARQAIDEADLVLFVIDAQDGLTPTDREVADMLRRSGRPLLAVANKVDRTEHESLANEMYRLGVEVVHGVSAAHGRGIGDLLDAMIALLPPPEAPATTAGEAPLRLAFVGKPNVGKSSLVNRLLGAERVLVHDQPGTTRDPIDTPFEYRGQQFVLVDTAGIRRRQKIDAPVERVAVILAERALARADICAVVIDAAAGPTEQDARLAGLVEAAGRAAVIVLNKSDLLRGQGDERQVRGALADQLPFMSWAASLTTSARTGQGVTGILDAALKARANHSRRVATGALNRLFEGIVERHPPPGVRGTANRLYYITQVEVRPPTFVVSASHPEGIPDSYHRYLIKEIREAFDFTGAPIRVRFHRRPRKRKARPGASSDE